MNPAHRHRPGGSGNRPRGAPGPEDRHLLIFGIHAVEAALGNPNRVIRHVALSDNAERRLSASLAARQLVHERVLPRDLDRRLGADTVHQGALLEAEPLPETTLSALSEALHHGPLLVLDQVTDPHNVGAILRSAAAFGAAGLVMTRRHSPPLSGALAKSASGALDLVPVLLVQNLARALLDLKSGGFVILGLDGAAEARLEDETFSAKTAIVLGA